jgi:TetR/AcrR family transcriptional regulator
MTSPRRMGAPDAKNRTVLLDAAERLLIEEGYPAVTSRQVAERAGLKPQLVHYYFRTMDDLFLAMFRRRGDEGLERQQQALAGDQPLKALWEFNTEADAVALTMEFAALANHRKAIRAEIALYAEKLRAGEIAAMTRLVTQHNIDKDELPPAVLAVLLSSVARMIVMEQSLGMSGGHTETLAFIARHLDLLQNGDIASLRTDADDAPKRPPRARRSR